MIPAIRYQAIFYEQCEGELSVQDIKDKTTEQIADDIREKHGIWPGLNSKVELIISSDC
jgi:hypothetical protein